MLSTRKTDGIRLCDRITVDSIELQELLGCGRYTAAEIGKRANARIQLGKRVLYNVAKVQAYLDAQAEQGEC